MFAHGVGLVCPPSLMGHDAKAITAPLIAQRDHARLQLAALPAADPVAETDTIDPDAFREAVREAWRARPLEERRRALSRVVEKVELSPGGLEIVCRADGYHGHDPFGPPWGSWGQWEVALDTSEVASPRPRGVQPACRRSTNAG